MGHRIFRLTDVLNRWFVTTGKKLAFLVVRSGCVLCGLFALCLVLLFLHWPVIQV